MSAADIEDEIEAALAAPPGPPSDPGRFSSDSEVIGPGIYDGPPMIPMAGPERSLPTLRAQLLEVALDPSAAADWLDSSELAAKVPDPVVRASVAALAGTVAEPAITALLADDDIERFEVGRPDGGGRIAGHAGRSARRVVNDRYRHEHVGVLAPAIAHEVLSHPTPRCDAEEKLLHGVLAMVHMQLLARAPALAALGTELARRVNSITLPLFNSRRPGSARFTLIAPDGPGTIPGGHPSMATPDFWSIPFLTGHPDPAPVPPPVLAVLTRLGVEPGAVGPTPSYDEATVDALDRADGLTWLSWSDRGTVGSALGVL